MHAAYRATEALVVKTNRRLPRIVLVLGLASLLNDAASEMIAPLLPLFLTATLGAGPAIVGFVEGMAQATSAVLRLVSGRLVDRGWSHGALIVSGYGLAALARPAIGLAAGWPQVLGLRFLDRVGKGVRGTARDALLSASVGADQRGSAFGLHRGLDHVGAMLGPLLAFALLAQGVEMRAVFLIAIVPGLLAVVLLLRAVPVRPLRQPVIPDEMSFKSPPVSRASAMPGATAGDTSPGAVRVERPPLDGRLRGLLTAAGVLAFAAVPDAFLVLWASQRGFPLVWIPLLWAGAHALRAAVALAAGRATDRVGRLPLLLGGWSARVVLVLALAFAGGGFGVTVTLFLLYAAGTAVAEPAEVALLGDLAPSAQRGTLFGMYHLLSGLLVLPGAVLFGALWQVYEMQVSFVFSASVTAVAAVAFLALARR